MFYNLCTSTIVGLVIMAASVFGKNIIMVSTELAGNLVTVGVIAGLAIFVLALYEALQSGQDVHRPGRTGVRQRNLLVGAVWSVILAGAVAKAWWRYVYTKAEVPRTVYSFSLTIRRSMLEFFALCFLGSAVGVACMTLPSGPFGF